MDNNTFIVIMHSIRLRFGKYSQPIDFIMGTIRLKPRIKGLYKGYLKKILALSIFIYYINY